MKLQIALSTVVAFSVTQPTLSSRVFHKSSVPAFAGGFGASSSSSSTKKKGKKGKKKRGGGLIAETLETKNNQRNDKKKADQNQGPELDRFGLPVRTAENFFPPLPDGMELISASKSEFSEFSSLDTIKSSMEKHIPLNYNIFDDNGAEQIQMEEEGGLNNNQRKPWKLCLLHQSPPVVEVENFFSADECLQYMSMTDGKGEEGDLDPLKVNSATFSSLAQSKRTSTTWYCHFSQVPTLLAKAKHLLNGLPLEQMEEAQIVRYRTGEEFSWHYDEIPKTQLGNGGQRIATLLVYLNTIQKSGGGGTVFRDLKDANGDELTMRPKQGSALLFFPALLDGTPDDRTLHKGEVAMEEKMIAQMWIHEKKYKPVIPDKNSHEAAFSVIERKEFELGFKNK